MPYALNVVAINGYQTIYGSGKAGVVIGATGYTAKQKTAVSTAALSQVQASGAGEIARTRKSTALIDVGAAGALHIATPGPASAANISVEAKHGIPESTVIPPGFTPTHSSRVVRVQKEVRDLDIYAESKFP